MTRLSVLGLTFTTHVDVQPWELSRECCCGRVLHLYQESQEAIVSETQGPGIIETVGGRLTMLELGERVGAACEHGATHRQVEDGPALQ